MLCMNNVYLHITLNIDPVTLKGPLDSSSSPPVLVVPKWTEIDAGIELALSCWFNTHIHSTTMSGVSVQMRM